MIFPTVPKFEGATELLDMLLNPKATAEVLKSIMDAQAMVDKSIERYKSFASVEAAQKDADAKMEEAQKARDESKKYVAAQKARADNLLAKAQEKIATREDALNKREIYLHNWSEKVNLQKLELDKREDKVARDSAEVARTKEYAERLFKEANEIKAEYESKLIKLREMAA